MMEGTIIIGESNENYEEFYSKLNAPGTQLHNLFDDVEPSKETTAKTSLRHSGTKEPSKPKKRVTIHATKHNNSSVSTTNTPEPIWITKFAKVATGYKEVASLGKVGVAVLVNDEGTFKIIVYKCRSNILSSLSIHRFKGDANTQLIRQDPFVQFHDDNGVFWSLLFDELEDDQEFMGLIQEMGIPVKYVTRGNEHLEAEERESGDTIMAPAVAVSRPSALERVSKVGKALPQLTRAAEKEKSPSPERRSPPLEGMPVNVRRDSVESQPNSTIVGGVSLEPYYLQMLLTEQRTQNAELRMNLSKMEMKIEKVLTKVEDIKGKAPPEPLEREERILELEEQILALKKTNRKLKQQLEEKTRMCIHAEILDKALENNKDKFAKLGANGVHDIMELLELLLGKALKYYDELEQCEKAMTENVEMLQECRVELQCAKNTHIESKERIDELGQRVSDLQEKLDQAEKEKAELEEKLQKEVESIELLRKRDQAQAEQTVKTIMNNLYEAIADEITNVPGTSITNTLLYTIGKTIRDQTLKAIAQTKTDSKA